MPLSDQSTTAQLLLKSQPVLISSAKKMIRKQPEEEKLFSFKPPRTDFDENIGLTGWQRAAAF